MIVTAKSGEKFSQSIASDCLSRLEDHKKIDFDEGIIREVAGTMYGGEHFWVLAHNGGIFDK